MRLGTWNCQTGLEPNWSMIEELNVDVLSVQECGTGTQQFVEGHEEWTCRSQPGGYGRGLAVMARAPYQIESSEPSEPYIVSTLISGPDRFRFVGFWAMTPKFARYSYTRQATRLVEQLPRDGLATVVAGDFNASKSPQHLRNVQRLSEFGLVSAYHSFHGVEHHEREEDPTSYYLWNEGRRYHMDFMFVPANWHILSIEIGTFANYTAKGLSDHVPIVATVRPEANSPS
jgi:hypothetical protein